MVLAVFFLQKRAKMYVTINAKQFLHCF